MHFCKTFLVASVVLLGSQCFATNVPEEITKEPEAYIDGSNSSITPHQYPTYPEETQFRRYVNVDINALSPSNLVDYDTDESVSVEDNEKGEGLYPMLHNANNSCAADSVLQTLLNLEFKPLKRLIDGNMNLSKLTVTNAIENIMKDKFGPTWEDPNNPEAFKIHDCVQLLKSFFNDLKTASVDFEILFAKMAVDAVQVDIDNLEFDLEEGEKTKEEYVIELEDLQQMMGENKDYIQEKLHEHHMTEQAFNRRVSPESLCTPRSILKTLSRFQDTYFGGVLDAEHIISLFANMLKAEEVDVMSFGVSRTLLHGGRSVSVKHVSEIVISLDVNKTLSIREQVEELGITGRHTGIVSFRPDGMELPVDCEQVTKIVTFPQFQIFKLLRTARQFKRLRLDGRTRANFFSHRPVDVPLQLAAPYDSVLRAVICYMTDSMPHYSVVFRDSDDSGSFFTIYDGVRKSSKIISERKAMQMISRKGLILLYQKIEGGVGRSIFSEYRPALNYPISITPLPENVNRNPLASDDYGRDSHYSADTEDDMLAQILQLSLFDR